MNKFIKILTISLMAFFLCFLPSCATTAKIVDTKTIEPIAIINMYTNAEVTMLDDLTDGSGILTKYINMANDDTNPISTLKLGAIAEAKILAGLENNPAFLPKQVVTSVKAYQKQQPSAFKKMSLARSLEGYKFFAETDKQKNAYILKELNAKYGMFIKLLFNKTIPSKTEDANIGDAYAVFSMEVTIKNVDSKTVYRNFFDCTSEKTVFLSSDSLSDEEREDFAELFPAIIDTAVDNFLATIK